jgi:hypothetical protein
MGYLHIENLYKNQEIMLFRECYALEKIHGTSAHVAWRDGAVWFHAGGEKHENFVKLFNAFDLAQKFQEMGHEKVVIFGEAYGGKQQAQSWRYGKDLKFIAFDVKVGDWWLDVSNAEQVTTRMGLEFVSYVRIPTDIESLDAARDAPSVQAKRNGIVEDQRMEGVVLRPLKEFHDNSGERIISKHKRPEERETRTPREVGDPAKLAVLEAADAIANEWVTPTRLEHVLDKLGPVTIADTAKVIMAMIEDVTREAKGEIVDSKEARKAISSATARLFKKRFQDALHASQ